MKAVEAGQEQTRTEEVNAEIVDNCTPALDAVFRRYYKSIGKPSYKFILSEEIGKVSKMTPEEFDKFTQIISESTQ
jgi:hypothetical protein